MAIVQTVTATRVSEKISTSSLGVSGMAIPFSVSSSMIISTTSWMCLYASPCVVPQVAAPYDCKAGQYACQAGLP